jgi:hypothetical protein
MTIDTEMRVDVPALQRLATMLRRDTEDPNMPGWYKNGIMVSITEHIERAIGAPVMQQTFDDGTTEADRRYPGSPDLRLAFNHGVKWCLEQISAKCRK